MLEKPVVVKNSVDRGPVLSGSWSSTQWVLVKYSVHRDREAWTRDGEAWTWVHCDEEAPSQVLTADDETGTAYGEARTAASGARTAHRKRLPRPSATHWNRQRTKVLPGNDSVDTPA